MIILLTCVNLQSERSKCKNILVNLKETAKAFKEECEKKEELSKQLRLKYEKLKGGNKRLSHLIIYLFKL